MRRAVGAASVVLAAVTAMSGVPGAAAGASPGTSEDVRLDAVRPPYPPPVGSVRMVSFRSSGEPGSFQSTAEDLSADGRLLVFISVDKLMVPGSNRLFQVYLRDLATAEIRLVTRGVDGEPANAPSEVASISADGSRIVFGSDATNLVPGVSGSQIYLYDAATDAISLVSRTPSGQGGNADSLDPAISADGTRVVFQSRADDLVPGAPLQDGLRQVYVADVASGSVQLVTPGAGGVPADEDSFEPSISGDGRLIAFRSEATNLGSGENDSDDDVFVRDTVARTLTQVSRSPTDRTGVSLYPEISDDGEHVVFTSTLRGLTDDPTRESEFHVYVSDLASGAVERVTRAADGGLLDPRRLDDQHPTISADGSIIAFDSNATNLMADQNDDNGWVDTFVYDRATEAITLVSRTRTGDTPKGPSGDPVLSGDGSYVAFGSSAKDLSDRDRDRSYDMFLSRLS